MRRAEHENIAADKKTKVTYRQRQEKKCLEKEPGNGSGARLLSQKSVQSEAGTQPERDERKMAITKGENRYAGGGDENGCDLPHAKSFTQNGRTEQDVDQRGHEVTKAGFKNPTNVNGPDEDEPVHTHHHPTPETKQCAARRTEAMEYFTPAALPGEQQAEEHDRPDKAVGENLQRGNFAE